MELAHDRAGQRRVGIEEGGMMRLLRGCRASLRPGPLVATLLVLTGCKSGDEPVILEECASYLAAYEACGTQLRGDPGATHRQLEATRQRLTLQPKATETERSQMRRKCVDATTQIHAVCQ